MALFEVYFESDREVISFCEFLFRNNRKISLHWRTDEKWGHCISFEDNMPVVEQLDSVAQSMTDVFLKHRLSKMVTHVIKDRYYYSDTAEVERILALTHWIFYGEDEDSLRIRDYNNPGQVLKTIFLTNIKASTSIHFDSIVYFQLQVFREQLVDFVGLAIDEFKREEDHQSFVNTLREYVSKKERIYPVIYVLQGEDFAFFKPSGRQFSKIELRMMLHKEPLYIVGLDVAEYNLAPLIAMSPAQINIYGDDPAEPKTLTLMNVFQERSQFEPLENFPFAHRLKNS